MSTEITWEEANHLRDVISTAIQRSRDETSSMRSIQDAHYIVQALAENGWQLSKIRSIFQEVGLKIPTS